MRWQCAKCIFDTNDFSQAVSFPLNWTPLLWSTMILGRYTCLPLQVQESPSATSLCCCAPLRFANKCYQVLKSALYQVLLNFDSTWDLVKKMKQGFVLLPEWQRVNYRIRGLFCYHHHQGEYSHTDVKFFSWHQAEMSRACTLPFQI